MKGLLGMEALLRTIGRSALVGTLAGLLATQAVASPAPTAAPQPAAQPETTSVSANAPAIETAAAATANLPLASYDSGKADVNALPDAPNIATQSASSSMPAEMKAMMDDAAQSAQNAQPAATEQKHSIHPGWLLLAGFGGLVAAIGSVGLTGSKDKGLAVGFLASGLAMTGGGIYLTFRK
jgi:hypothetical protein